jgi:cytoskeletal protein RodZ
MLNLIGEQSRDAPQKDRLRRRLFLLLLLLLAFALGGISVAWWRGAPEANSVGPSAVPSAVPSVGPSVTPSAVPSESSIASGESPGSSQVVPTPVASASGGGGGAVHLGDAGFTITGSVGNLVPGVATPIQLTLTNPNGVPIYVTALTVTVAPDSSPPGCSSAANLEITQSNASVASPIVVAAKSSLILPSAPSAPQITLRNLAGINQDVCKGKSFILTYSGSAHS